MDLLIIGGTRFLGRALVQSAKARGHRLTLFNRGISNPALFPEVEHLTGDRSADVSALNGRRWDAVIDTCGFEPAGVRLTAAQLAGAVDLYTFISTLSVYGDTSQPGIDEDDAVAQLPEGDDEHFKMENYGPLKALCEQAAEQAMPGRVLTIRPGLIVGEYDATDRFSYWPWRIAQGGEVLAPGRPAHLTQFIDVRDLAEWTIHMVEGGNTGVYNATGPESPATMGELLETSRVVSGSSAHITWAPEAFLLENKVEPWTELPLWLPENDPALAGMDQMSIRKALQAGLTFRPLEDTVQSTLAWVNSRPAGHKWRAGLTREREAALLDLLKLLASGKV
jgi:2'-hydroxyisoflavone reductase